MLALLYNVHAHGKFNIEAQSVDRYNLNNLYLKTPRGQGSEYTHEQLLDIAHRYLKEMGYAEERQPLLVYAHHDTDNNHIHIITSRVAPDGHKIDHNHEKRRSHQVTQNVKGAVLWAAA